MKVKSIGANKTLVKIGSNEIFVSYSTPVAGFITGIGYFKTSEFFSVTTSKHINQYLEGITKITIIPQDRIDKFLDNQDPTQFINNTLESDKLEIIIK